MKKMLISLGSAVICLAVLSSMPAYSRTNGCTHTLFQAKA